jgi:hypothetical protein
MTAQILSGVIVGVAVAVIGTIAAHLLTKRQLAAWERVMQLRHRDDRIALYKTFLANARTATESRTAAEKEDATEAILRLREAHLRVREDAAGIELLGSEEVSSAAVELFHHTASIMRLEVDRQAAKAEGNYEAAERHRADKLRLEPEFRKRRVAFVVAVREELGVDVGRGPEEAEG